MLSLTQKQAVCHKAGPCLTLAGPGSGKTYVLTRRICHLISEEGVKPENILVITFTKAAAIEMKERFSSLMGENAPVVFGTFHSVFLRMLRGERCFGGYELLTGKRKREILKEVLISCHLPWENEDEMEALEKEISYVNNGGIHPDEYVKESMWGEDFIRLFEHYRARKAAYHLMDFDDIITGTRDLLKRDKAFREKWQKQFTYVLVDEAQDMNAVQYEAVGMVALPQNNLFFVGDDDQSIYGFRGANPNLMLHFREDYPEATLIRLGENYRSGRKIVEAVGRLISCNTNRFDKEVESRSQEEGIWRQIACETMENEIALIQNMLRQWHEEGIAYKDMAVLFRNHNRGGMLVEHLSAAEIPFFLRDRAKNPYQHGVMLDLVSYLRLGSKMLHRRDLFRIMNRPNRYLSRAAIGAEWISFAHWKAYYRQQPWLYERLEQLERHVDFYGKLSGRGAVKYIRKVVGYDAYLAQQARTPEELEQWMQMADALETLAEEGISVGGLLEQWEERSNLFEKVNAHVGKEDKAGVGLYTLHSCKGLEFERVIILGCNEGSIPSGKAKTEMQVEEERRLFYVGITRAKKELVLTYILQHHEEKISPSRFLGEMQGAKGRGN